MLHPQVREMLDALAKSDYRPVRELAPAAARQQFEDMVRARAITPTPVGAVHDRRIPGPAGELPVRVYRPDTGQSPRPGLVYFHGGGHVVGSLDTHDSVCRNLCVQAECVVVSVDYRLGPEARFPAAVEDSFAATRWLADNAPAEGVDAARIAVGGDSAGGNLAAAVALMAREAGAPALRFQLLVYPIADYGCDAPSYLSFARGYGPLEAEDMRWYRDQYLRGPRDADDWRASPLRAASLASLPPALVITASHDVLRDEGAAYAERLAAAGVATEHVQYQGLIHGFFSMAPLLDEATTAQARAAAALRAALA